MKNFLHFPASAQPFLLAVAVLLLPPLLSCSPAGLNGLRSQVRIEVGKQFELGGKQLLGFRVEANNVGPVAVEVKELTKSGNTTSLGVIAPGQKTDVRFGLGSKALLVNLGQREAKIDVDVTNGAGLGMTYGPAQPSAATAH